jgi:hypothetical protein
MVSQTNFDLLDKEEKLSQPVSDLPNQQKNGKSNQL